MELSDYERLRIENIKKNDQYIQSLDLTSTKPVIGSFALTSTSNPKKRRNKITKLEPTRKSSRVGNSPSPNEHVLPDDYSDEEDEEEKTQTAKKRQAIKSANKGIENSKKVANRSVKGGKIEIYSIREPIPSRDTNGCLYFPDYPQFRPNLTPKEVMQMGSFGGTYFRVIKSGVTGETYHNAWKEFPSDWFEGLNIQTWVSSQNYNQSINTYKVSCGGDLHMWESSGWITEVDPFGWFQWYCRFYLGRRCSDDDRQIGRGLGVMGPTGRWRSALVKKCLSMNKPLAKVVDDVSVSPKVRQLLQHWGYKLSLKDLEAAARKI